MRNIDIHAHIIPADFLELIEKDKKYMVDIIEKGGAKKLVFEDKSIHPLDETFYDTDNRIAFMDKNGISVQVISVTPRFFFYNYPTDIAYEIAVLSNNEIAKIVNTHKDRFIGMGTVPLQDVDLSIKELKRMKNDLNINSVQISSHVNDKKLSDPLYFRFFEEAAKNDMAIFIHPPINKGGQFLEDYHLSNVLGNPYNTTVAAANLIFSGIFDKLPNLKLCLAHGGGFLPYQMGRLQRAYEVRNEAKANIKKSPMEYVKDNFFFDTVIHSVFGLEYLIKNFGSDKVMLGSDYPYDMGEYDTVEKLEELKIDENSQQKILFENAEKFLGVI